MRNNSGGNKLVQEILKEVNINQEIHRRFRFTSFHGKYKYCDLYKYKGEILICEHTRLNGETRDEI